ncbi:MAG: hypothetical protein CSA32_02800 [Desulfobulbus propionicus]|nr:MAG: hypothetical protein CSA32_02800 [Desulfobulbus propionicus]
MKPHTSLSRAALCRVFFVTALLILSSFQAYGHVALHLLKSKKTTALTNAWRIIPAAPKKAHLYGQLIPLT